MLEALKNVDGCSWTTGATSDQLIELAAIIGGELPACLREYLLIFGTLSVGHIELLGLNATFDCDELPNAIDRYRDMCSDRGVVRFVPVAELGNGDFFAVCMADELVYLFCHELDEWACLDVNMCEWLLRAFSQKPYQLLPESW